MNKKKNLWNHLLTALLIAALLMAQITPAFALEGEPTTSLAETTEPATELSDEPATDVGEGTDTPDTESPSEAPETAIQTVSTLEELLQAIEQTEAGATIGIGGEIICPDGTTLGDFSKKVTIQRTAPEGRISAYSPDGTGNTIFQNIVFDGGNVEVTTPFIQTSISSTFNECRFSNCSAGAVEAENGDQFFVYCTFENNAAQYGAHIRINNGTANIVNCVFSGGTATIRGGAIAIFTDQEVTLDRCEITENTASQRGGGIWNKGNLTITQCRIHGNTAPWEPDDIVNDYQGRLALMDNHEALVALYAPYGLIPNKWAVDTFEDEYSAKSHMVFSMTFATNDPEPDPEPEPEPTPDPEPIPDPEPTPEPETEEPAHSSHSRPSVRPSTTQTEAPKEITLTNGKAVLNAPEADYWAGYETSCGSDSKAITRADLAVLVVSMMDQESGDEWATHTAPFDDVEPGKWYAAAIGTASNAGIMVGCGNGKFAPERPLIWGELITVFSRFTDGEPPAEVYTGGHWAKEAINTAISLEWIEYSEAFDPGGVVTCGEMVSFIQTVFQWAAEKT